MEIGVYKITNIDGEYAYIKSQSRDDAEELFIAMALLPVGCDVGTLLEFENFEFTIVN